MKRDTDIKFTMMYRTETRNCTGPASWGGALRLVEASLQIGRSSCPAGMTKFTAGRGTNSAGLAKGTTGSEKSVAGLIKSKQGQWHRVTESINNVTGRGRRNGECRMLINDLRSSDENKDQLEAQANQFPMFTIEYPIRNKIQENRNEEYRLTNASIRKDLFPLLDRRGCEGSSDGRGGRSEIINSTNPSRFSKHLKVMQNKFDHEPLGISQTHKVSEKTDKDSKILTLISFPIIIGTQSSLSTRREGEEGESSGYRERNKKQKTYPSSLLVRENRTVANNLKQSGAYET